MDKKTLKLINKILKILSKKQYSLTPPPFYFEPFDRKNFLEYLRYCILEDFTQDDLDILKSKIYIAESKYDECGIKITNRSVDKVVLPDMTNVLSTIIIVHELQHYITFKNKLKNSPYMSLYDELIPINSEFKYLIEFYNNHIKEHKNYRFNEAIKCAQILSTGLYEENKQDFNIIFNQLSHIYSLLILYQNDNYMENSVIFDKINKTANSLEYEFSKEGIYLKESIIRELKNNKQ